jgi:cell division protein FtsB
MAMDVVWKFSFRFLLLLALLVTAIFVPMKLFDTNGIPRIRKLTVELQDIRRANEELASENSALKEEIYLFHNDASYLEKVARDQFGMVGPFDLVYQFPTGLSSPKEAEN